MPRTLRRRIVALMAAAAVPILVVLAAPGAWAAYVLNEVYSCSGIHSDDYHVYGTCNGSWYNASPGPASYGGYGRTVVVDTDQIVTITNGSVTYRNTRLRFIENRDTVPGDSKIFTVYCEHPNGTTTAHKGAIYSLGGGLTQSHTFSGSGYDPCASADMGMLVTVSGKYETANGDIYGPYITTIHENSDTSGILKESAHQITVF